MRRRRRLQVDTSPFMAVLLCAMGSLILVLLIMDRRARLAANERVQQQIAKREEDTQRKAEARKAAQELARRAVREEWESKRNALHETLTKQHDAIATKVKSLEQTLQGSQEKLRYEDARLVELENQVRAQQAAIEAERKALAQRQTRAGQIQAKDAEARKALAKMQQQLSDVERVLRNLTTVRTEEKSAYSVVPYRGKFGEDRNPHYVECAKGTVIFHPEEVKFNVPLLHRELRQEVTRRIAQRGNAEREVPYLLLLIRPEGILTYYELLDALNGLPIEFGYELIESDWKMRFPKNPAPVSTPSTPSGFGVGPALGPPSLGMGVPPSLRGRGMLPALGGASSTKPPEPKPLGATPSEDKPPSTASSANPPRGSPTLGSGPRKRALGHATLGEDRRDRLFVECRLEGVVLYPKEERLSLETLAKPLAENPLYQEVQKMIQRRGADVQKKRDAIQVRFLVRPDGFRAYHQAYPLLERLPIAKIRQNLNADTDVLTVIQETH